MPVPPQSPRKVEALPANPFLIFLTHRRWAWLRHLLLWAMIFSDYGLFNIEANIYYAAKVNVDVTAFYIGKLINALFAIAVIYFNIFVLIPRYLQKNEFLKYFIICICLGGLFFILNYVTQQIWVLYFGKNAKDAVPLTLINIVEGIVYPMMFLGATTGYRVFKEWIADQKRLVTLEKEKMQTELTQLKNQVNPHFLFNTLNNLHVLIQTKPQKAVDIVLGLSDVMRYQIYDSQHDNVLLKKDIDVLRQYLELEKIRRDDLTVRIKIGENENETLAEREQLLALRLPPLLFTNFVDNAIKHSNSSAATFVDISFQIITKENGKKRLFFEIQNSKSSPPTPQRGDIFIPPLGGGGTFEGLGLANIQKRLQLLYGNEYEMRTIEAEKTFTVQVEIPI
ncbi:MAG: hypothetical protein RL757_771 [Bacteroidota bacterium]|jgi:LytS/YehU family sensor histidine kinase